MFKFERIKSWTGFYPYTDAEGKRQPGKTLWDWMSLLLVPILVGGGLAVYNQVNHDNEIAIADKRAEIDRDIAEENAQEVALQSYIDRMDKLLVDDHLGQQAEKNGALAVAQTLTLTVLRRLNNERKSTVIHFLGDAMVIQFINLQHVDLSETDLSVAYLFGADLYDADLSGADLSSAELNKANLSGAHLNGAHLYDTDFFEADLSGAIMDSLTSMNDQTLLPDGTKWTPNTDMTKYGVRMETTGSP